MALTDPTIGRTAQGFLLDRGCWTPRIAEELAMENNLTLTAAHWHILHFLRFFYQNYQNTPPLRALIQSLREAQESLALSTPINSATLYNLFPEGPLKQGSLIAGLPKPARCT